MSTFTYKALDTKGHTTQGVVEADSAKIARQLLRDRGLIPVNVSAYTDTSVAGKKSGISLSLKRRPSLSLGELALATRQLATLLSSGIPLEEALQAVAEQSEKPRIKNILFSVRSKVLEGNTFGAGLGAFPSAFPEVYRATVSAGEQTGRLDRVLLRLAEYTEKQQEMRQKIQQALIYPLLMTLVSVSIVIFLMIFVVPSMVSVFISSKQVLPLSTRILLVISNNMSWAGPAILVGGIALVLGTRYLIRTNSKVKQQIHILLLRLPLLGHTIRTINTARFSRTFGILLAAGVPVLDAMKGGAAVVQNVLIRQAVGDAIAHVREGSSIHRALQQTGYFPPMSLHLLASGESSGQLENMLDRVADNQETEVRRWIETLLTLFEPILILVMGSVVMFIVMAVLLPIFDLNQLVG